MRERERGEEVGRRRSQRAGGDRGMWKRNGRDREEREDQLYQMEIRKRHGGKRSHTHTHTHTHTPLYIKLQGPPWLLLENYNTQNPLGEEVGRRLVRSVLGWSRTNRHIVSTVSIRMEPDKPSHR